MSKATIFAFLLVALAACRMDARQRATATSVAGTGAPPTTTPPSDPREFVAAFYSWYNPETGLGHNVDDVRTERRAWLGIHLAAALDSDRACLAKSGGEICGLDSDPFVNGQDACGPFRVGDAVPKNGIFEVPLFSACASNVGDTIPWVLVIVQSDSGANKIADLRYPNHGADVFTLIKQAHQP